MRQTIDKVATTILRFILPLTAFSIPLFFLPITPNFFDYNKTYLLYIFASISLLAWTARIIARRRLHITLAPSTLPLLGLALIYILSSFIQSPTITLSLLGKTSLVLSLVIIFLSTTTSQKNEFTLTSTIYALIASTTLLSLFSLLQFLDLGQRFLSVDFLKDKTFTPAGGIFPYLSVALALIPGTLYLGFKSEKLIAKIALFIVSALMIIASISQINLIATSSAKFIWPFLPFSVGWSIMIDIFKNLRTAFLGTGPENFLATFTALRPAVFNLSPVWNIRFTTSSNELFNTITTTGILGGIFYITAILRPLNSKVDKFSYITLVTTALITLIIPANTVLLTLLFICLTLVNLSLKLSTPDLVKDVTLNLFATSDKESSSFNQFLVWFFALPSLILLAVFWFFAGKAYAASLATYQALTLINTNASESYNQQARAYTLDPYNPTYRINFAQTSLALANSIASQKDLKDQDKNNISQLIQQAIREAKNATQINPQSVVGWENLASTYRQLTNFAQGATDWTLASYNQAIALDPTNPALRLDLGGVYYSLNDFDSAIKVFGQAADLKPNWANAHYNLASAYKANKNINKALEEMRVVVQLIDVNSEDYQKAQDELSQLEKAVAAANPTPAGQSPLDGANTKQANNIELVTPTPAPTNTAKINLPENAGPEITPTPTPIASPTPTP